MYSSLKDINLFKLKIIKINIKKLKLENNKFKIKTLFGLDSGNN
jgi:hypothetical protein